ncbi:nucleotidyltransferase domain-containing protein [Candidatus Pacearchaeota archaeon]|nr:nucleotidyltransferase domain-containing protein [Candidatus Pacearchaeota archaeon]
MGNDYIQCKGLYTINGTVVYKMAQINQKWDKVLELFFEYPNKSFSVREISKKARIPSSSVHRYLQILKKENLITAENKAIITLYFKFKKTFYIIDKIYNIGLLDFINRELNPSLVIVFGSVRKGEYEKESDIDIFIESSIDKKLNLEDYERKIGHKIQIFVEKDIKKIQPNLFKNVINGIKIEGYLDISLK